MAAVSIVIPVYNEGPYIEKTLRSVVNEADEVVVCDNASTDETSEICSAFAKKHPHVRHIRHERNIGAGRNFAACFNLASGDYLRIVGGHDMISQFSTQSMVHMIESRSDVAMVYSGYRISINSEYSISNTGSSHKESFISRVASSSPYVRTLGMIEERPDYCVYYGLYKSTVLRHLINQYRIFEYMTDTGFLACVASTGKLLPDNKSIYFVMDKEELKSFINDEYTRHEYIRYARTTTGGECENPYFWPFAIMCEHYNLLRQMQNWDEAPPKFSQTAFELVLRQFARMPFIPVDRTNLPPICPGKEELANKVFAIAQSFRRNGPGIKVKDRARLIAYDLLSSSPFKTIAHKLRTKLRGKGLID
ncbi:MAG: glycosyltransferase family 2 protein [Planctomycetaceae bacterium]|nr:glycosyltransferase family 2 protein [Planctomycetaceae bacterium]